MSPSMLGIYIIAKFMVSQTTWIFLLFCHNDMLKFYMAWYHDLKLKPLL